MAIFISDSIVANAMPSITIGGRTYDYTKYDDEVWSFAESIGYESEDKLPEDLKTYYYFSQRKYVPRIKGNGDGTVTIKWNPLADAVAYYISFIGRNTHTYYLSERVSTNSCTFPFEPDKDEDGYTLRIVGIKSDGTRVECVDGVMDVYMPPCLNKSEKYAKAINIQAESNSNSVTIKFKDGDNVKDYTVLFNGVEYPVTQQANNYGWRELKISNLKPNQTYTYAVRANLYSKIGVYSTILWKKHRYRSVPGEYSETYTVTTDHESIGNVKITQKSATESSVSVSWSGAANAKVFDLVVDGKRYTTTDWSKTVTGLTPGKTYNVYVVAKNDYKTNISDTYEIKTPPKAPSGVVVTPGENSARINWNKTEGAGYYELQYSVDGKQYTPTTEGTSYTITGLKQNTKYSVKIRCCTRDGKGEYGNAVSFTTGKAASITTAPSLSSASAGAYSADIKWTTVSGASSYELLFGNKTYTTSYNYYNVPTLTPGTTYKYKIRGKNEGSTGPYSSEYSITIPPNPPENLNDSASETSVTLSWNKVDGATGYVVNFNGTTKTYSSDVTSATYTGLVADTTYNCSIACKNAYGTGSYRGWGYVKTLKESQPLSIPEAEIYATDKSVTLEWNAVAGATKYELEANDKKYTTTGLRYTITGLSPNTSYYIKLVALNDKYKRDNLYLVRTAPSAPTPSATATNDSIRVYWAENYNARGYTVRFDGVDYETDQTSMTFNGLQMNTTHTYAVCSHGSYGNSEFSSIYSISTKSMFETLSVPTGISKKIIARDRAMISWDEVPYADRYEIEINGTLYSVTKDWGNFELPYGKTSYFRIRAVGKTSVSPYTPMYTFKMPPKGPSNVTATSTHNSITLRWNPVPGAEGYIINNQYEIGPSQTTYTLTGLNADREYYYYVGCNTEDGHLTSDGAYYEGIIKTKTLTLDVPTGFVNTTNETEFNLTWNPVKNADSYVVEINGVTWDVTKPKLYVPGYKNGTQLNYRVAAKGAGVTGPFSAMMTTYTAYPAPWLYEAGINTDNSVTFAWNTDSRCTGYELWINGKTYSFSAETSNFKLENATGEPLTYKIRSKYKNSYSKYSAEKVVYPYATPVKNIRADVGDRYINLYWDPSPGADHYLVFMNSPNYRSWTDRNVRACEYHYTDIPDSLAYTIEIYPVNAKGQRTDMVYPLTVRTKLGPPYLLDSKPARVGTDFVELNWYESWGGKSYEIVFDGKKYQATGTQYRITGLEPGTKHTYKMCSINGNERSRYTEEHEIETLPLPLKAPTNITAEASATDVLISWDDIPDATGYIITVNGKQFNAPNSPLRLKALDPNTEYSFTIKTKNKGGVGTASEEISFHTLLSTPVIKNVKVNGTKAEISVSRDSGADNYVFILDGIEYRTEDPIITFAGLEPGKEYAFMVRTENDKVSSKNSSGTFTTGSNVPAMPTDISISRTKSSITLKWPSVPNATSYDIIFDGTTYHVDDDKAVSSGEGTIVVNPVEEETHELSQKFQRLMPGTTYYYQIRANNACGSSEYTESMPVWTEEARDEAYNSDYNYDVTDSKRDYLDGKKNYTSGDPIDSVTGALLWSNTIVEDYGSDDLHFDIMYKSDVSNGVDGTSHEMGKKWTHNFNYTIRLIGKNVYFTTPYDVTIPFVKSSKGYKNMLKGDKSTFTIDSNSRRVVTTGDGVSYYFDSTNRLTQIAKNGKPVYTFTWDSKKKTMSISTDKSSVIQVVYSNSRVSSVKDALGNTTKFTYTDGVLTKITNPQNAEVKFEYENGGRLTKVVGFDGTAYLTNTYDEDGRVVSQEYSNGASITADYDDENRINRFTDESGNVISYMYDENGRVIYVSSGEREFLNEYDEVGHLVKQTDSEGYVYETEYDSKGRVIKVIYPDKTFEETAYSDKGKPYFVKSRDGLSVYFEYDENGNVTKYTDKAGNVCEYLYDNAGNLVTYTDFEGNKWNYEYDENSHLSKAIDPEGNESEFTYDKAGKIISYTSPIGGTTRYEYSKGGQLLKEIEDDGTTEYSYDVNGNVSEIKDKKGNTESYKYDTMGNVIMKTDRMGNTYYYDYDSAGRLSSTIYPDGWVDAVEYDSFGNKVYSEDQIGNPTFYEYDKNGRMTQKVDALGGKSTYEYNYMDQIVAETDPLGHVTRYSYDNLGRLLSVTDALGYVKSYTYDSNGNIATETDEEGNTVSYEYDKENRLVKKTDSIGSETTSYDKAGNEVVSGDKLGYSETYVYDSDGNVTEIIDKENNKTTYAYDQYGRLISKTTPDNAVTEYTYDENNNCIAVKDAVNNTVRYAYNANNQISEVTDSDGNKTTFTYNSLGKIKEIKDANGNTTSYWYDGNGNLASVINGLSAIRHYEYDELNRCIGGLDEFGNKWSCTYDAVGNRTSYTDLNGHVIRFTYDADNRLTDATDMANASLHYEYSKTDEITSVTDEEGAVTSYEYDELGRVTKISDALGNSTSFTYDANDNILTQTDANGNTRSFTYSPEGNLLSEKDAEGNETSYTYDSVGNVTSKTDANGNVTQYEYNALGKPTVMTDASGAKTEFTYAPDGNISSVKNAYGDTTYYYYDPCGNLVKITDELGVSTCFEYDAMNNRIKEYVDDEGTQKCVTLYEYDRKGRCIKEITPLLETKEYRYDKNGNLTDYVDEEGRITSVWYDYKDNPELKVYSDGTRVAYRYNKRGELLKITDWNGDTTFERDIVGRITKVTEYDGQTVGYSYDGVGNVVSIEYPNGKVVTYGYDKNNRVSTVEESGVVVGAYVYDGVGNITQINQPDTNTLYEYNSNNMPVSMLIQKDGHTEAKEEYGYDLLGRMISKEIVTGDYGVNETTGYSYDAKGRLIAVTGNNKTEEYTYDILGNRISKLVNSTDLTTYTYNEKNQLVSRNEDGHAYTYAYDKCGNLIREDKDGETAIEYTYNLDGKLIKGINHKTQEETAYDYNALGMMLKNTRTYREVEDLILEELDTNLLTDIALPDSEILPEADISGNETVADEVATPDNEALPGEEEIPGSTVVPGGEDISENDAIPDAEIIPNVPELPTVPDVSGEEGGIPMGVSAIVVSSIDTPIADAPTVDVPAEESVSSGEVIEIIETPEVVIPEAGDVSSNQGLTDVVLPDLNTDALSDVMSESEDIEKVITETETEADELISAVPTVYSVRYINDYLSDTWNALCEIDSEGKTTTNIYGKSYQILARENEDGLVSAKTDLYMTPFALTDGDGNIIVAGFKDVWGNETVALSDIPWFTSYIYDPVIDKYFAKARFYDPVSGRMLSVDPVKSGLNRYTYCNDDPADMVDPDGESVIGVALDFGLSFVESLLDSRGNGKTIGEKLWDATVYSAVETGKTAASNLLKPKGPLSIIGDFALGFAGDTVKQLFAGEKFDFDHSMMAGVQNVVTELLDSKEAKLLVKMFKGGVADATNAALDFTHEAVKQAIKDDKAEEKLRKQEVKNTTKTYSNNYNYANGSSTNDSFEVSMGTTESRGYKRTTYSIEEFTSPVIGKGIWGMNKKLISNLGENLISFAIGK